MTKKTDDMDIVEALGLTEHQLSNAEAQMRMGQRLGYSADRLADTILRALELTDAQVAQADKIIKNGLLIGRARKQAKDIRTLGKAAPTTEKTGEKTRRLIALGKAMAEKFNQRGY